jgi:hypothetical protein
MDWSDIVQFIAPFGTATLAFLMGWDRYVRSQYEAAPKAQLGDHTTHGGIAEARSAALVAKLTTMEGQLADIAAKTRELHKWHDQRDQEGRPLWYRNQGAERALEKLSSAIDNLGAVVQELRVEVHRPPREPPSGSFGGNTDHG